MQKVNTIIAALLLSLFSTLMVQAQDNILSKVNPFIGTAAHGHTYPGATLPFGMVQLSPDTRVDSWDGCSGYHYSDSLILGFSHTHLSGTGVGDYGDIRLMPTVGARHYDAQAADNSQAYASAFSHQREEASPAYYSVFLEDYSIDVELTAAVHSGYHRYHFPSTEQAHIVLDLTAAVRSESIHDLQLVVESNSRIKGLRRSGSWAADQYCYFVIEFSQPFKDFGLRKEGVLGKENTVIGVKDLQACFDFDAHEGKPIEVRVGVSACSMDNAAANLQAEIPRWQFEATKAAGQQAWRKALSTIEVMGEPEQEEVFYTALYHSLLAPNTWSDVNGDYRGHDGEIHHADFTVYTVFSLWDTFRAEHPLLSMLYPQQSLDMIKSMLLMYEQGGLLPVWELAANETQCMIGYHAAPVIYDAYKQGITSFDAEKALEAMVKSAMQDKHGLSNYKQYGYVKADEEGESVSKTLEYAYDDWCIAQMAKALGRQEVYDTFIQRAQNYKNVFSAEQGFMRAKLNAQWQSPFSPSEVNFHFTEANSWQYSMFVPQDIEGMIALYGGALAFEQKLDSLFYGAHKLSGRHQADITGLIGQYAHGNEPSHHMAYLYNYIGKPWKAQKVLDTIMESLYLPTPAGLCGNEDCGQMSAWYVLSAMGVYPVCPGSGQWALGAPQFYAVRVHLPNGKHLRIEASANPANKPYVQAVFKNGQPYTKSYISYADWQQGGQWSFVMGAQPNKAFAKAEVERPNTAIEEALICPVPYVQAPSQHFTRTMAVELRCPQSEAEIYYTLDSTLPNKASQRYEAALNLTHTSLIRARAYTPKQGWSKAVEARFYKLDTNRRIELLSSYSQLYPAGGSMALIDKIRGNNNFKTGTWQGYYDKTLEAIVQYDSPQQIEKISIGFIQDQGSWIFLPKRVSFYLSEDKQHWTPVGSLSNEIDQHSSPLIHDFEIELQGQQASYIKIVADNAGACPPWHLGAGGKTWLFADEIVITTK